jgi:paraquat-inducible protein B
MTVEEYKLKLKELNDEGSEAIKRLTQKLPSFREVHLKLLTLYRELLNDPINFSEQKQLEIVELETIYKMEYRQIMDIEKVEEEVRYEIEKLNDSYRRNVLGQKYLDELESKIKNIETLLDTRTLILKNHKSYSSISYINEIKEINNQLNTLRANLQIKALQFIDIGTVIEEIYFQKVYDVVLKKPSMKVFLRLIYSELDIKYEEENGLTINRLYEAIKKARRRISQQYF